jgi:hypothetical protein
VDLDPDLVEACLLKSGVVVMRYATHQEGLAILDRLLEGNPKRRSRPSRSAGMRGTSDAFAA